MTTLTARPDQYLTVTRAYQPVPLPEGGILITSDLAGHPGTYRLDSAGSWPRRVAASSDRMVPVGAAWGGILMRHDRGGNETWQLSRLDPAGTLHQLTRDAAAIHRTPVIGPDRRWAGLSYNPGGQVDFVLGAIDLETGEIDEWASPGGNVQWAAWHPDGNQAAAIRGLGSGRSEAYIFTRGSRLRQVLPEAHAVPSLLWAGRRLLAITDLGSEFLGLAEVDQADPSRLLRWLHHPDHDLRCAVPDPEGGRLAVAVQEGFQQRLLLVDAESGGVKQEFELPAGVLYSDNVTDAAGQLAWDGDRLFAAWETPTRPAEIYELFEGKQWTFAGPQLPVVTDPTPVSYSSFDRLEIPALLFRSGEGPRPTVVSFHGGPESQLVASFNPIIQFFCACGFNVLAPNVRGSSGYGVTYLHLDDRELRWDSVRDGCEAARYLKREGIASQTAVTGGSYGGFMTLATITEDPELWDAAVSVVGIADWHSFFRNTSGWRRASRTSEYGDPDLPADSEFLERFNPLRRAHLIRTPLLVLHGRNDPRVPVSEAEQIVAATGAELMIFEDEGHGLVRHANRVRGYGRAAEFLVETLG